jgi:rhodanese-related sulfurtransferase
MSISMPISIDRDRVRELVAQQVPLLDVLGAEAYQESHIPQALNLPLKELDRQSVAKFSPEKPFIVYCDDFQ